MIKLLRSFLKISGFFLVLGVPLYGVEPLSTTLADITEETSLLRQEVGQLRLGLEVTSKEHARLQEQLKELGIVQKHLTEQQKSEEKSSKTTISNFEGEWARYKKDVLVQVTDQIEKLSQKTQEALDSFAKSLTGKVVLDDSIFDEDYPKQGVVYTVKQGDTLSEIALKNSSKIKDIQDANKITKPKHLRVGQSIFIPQRS